MAHRSLVSVGLFSDIHQVRTCQVEHTGCRMQYQPCSPDPGHHSRAQPSRRGYLGRRRRSLCAQELAVGLRMAFATVFAGSAIYGYRQTSACEEIQDGIVDFRTPSDPALKPKPPVPREPDPSLTVHTDGAPSYQPSGSQLSVVSETSSRWFAFDAGMASGAKARIAPEEQAFP